MIRGFETRGPNTPRCLPSCSPLSLASVRLQVSGANKESVGRVLLLDFERLVEQESIQVERIGKRKADFRL